MGSNPSAPTKKLKMENEKLKVVYEDRGLLVIDKPAGITVFSEKPTNEKTLIDLVLQEYPELKNIGRTPRYGMVHRLDKDTSGILLVAKNDETLEFLQKQFKTGQVVKKYLVLAAGKIKNDKGVIETLMGRSSKNRKKQKVYLFQEPAVAGKRKSITEYKVLERFQNYTLVEVAPKTGRKHQIRTHLAYLGHPIAGDKLYSFKNQLCPEELNRQFLHASYLKIKLAGEETKEFYSELPNELKKILQKLKI